MSRQPSEKEFPAIKSINAGSAKVWSGKIGRLRIYDQPASTGKKVFAYKSSGTNSDYVGYSAVVFPIFAGKCLMLPVIR